MTVGSTFSNILSSMCYNRKKDKPTPRFGNTPFLPLLQYAAFEDLIYQARDKFSRINPSSSPSSPSSPSSSISSYHDPTTDLLESLSVPLIQQPVQVCRHDWSEYTFHQAIDLDTVTTTVLSDGITIATFENDTALHRISMSNISILVCNDPRTNSIRVYWASGLECELHIQSHPLHRFRKIMTTLSLHDTTNPKSIKRLLYDLLGSDISSQYISNSGPICIVVHTGFVKQRIYH